MLLSYAVMPPFPSWIQTRIGAPCRRYVLPWQRRSLWILLTLGATPPFTWLQGCGVSRILAAQSWFWWLSDCLGHFGTLHYWDTLGYIGIHWTIIIYACVYIICINAYIILYSWEKLWKFPVASCGNHLKLNDFNVVYLSYLEFNGP